KTAPSTAPPASNDPPHDTVLGQQPRPQPRTPTKHTPSATAAATRTTHTSANNHAHDIEHSCGTHNRHRRRPRAGNATTHTSASNHAHDIEHPRSPHHRPQRRPPASNEPTTPQPAPTLWRGTLRRSRKGDARQGAWQQPDT